MANSYLSIIWVFSLVLIFSNTSTNHGIVSKHIHDENPLIQGINSENIDSKKNANNCENTHDINFDYKSNQLQKTPDDNSPSSSSRFAESEKFLNNDETDRSEQQENDSLNKKTPREEYIYLKKYYIARIIVAFLGMFMAGLTVWGFSYDDDLFQFFHNRIFINIWILDILEYLVILYTDIFFMVRWIMGKSTVNLADLNNNFYPEYSFSLYSDGCLSEGYFHFYIFVAYHLWKTFWIIDLHLCFNKEIAPNINTNRIYHYCFYGYFLIPALWMGVYAVISKGDCIQDYSYYSVCNVKKGTYAYVLDITMDCFHTFVGGAIFIGIYRKKFYKRQSYRKLLLHIYLLSQLIYFFMTAFFFWAELIVGYIKDHRHTHDETFEVAFGFIQLGKAFCFSPYVIFHAYVVKKNVKILKEMREKQLQQTQATVSQYQLILNSMTIILNLLLKLIAQFIQSELHNQNLPLINNSYTDTLIIKLPEEIVSDSLNFSFSGDDKPQEEIDLEMIPYFFPELAFMREHEGLTFERLGNEFEESSTTVLTKDTGKTLEIYIIGKSGKYALQYISKHSDFLYFKDKFKLLRKMMNQKDSVITPMYGIFTLSYMNEYFSFAIVKTYMSSQQIPASLSVDLEELDYVTYCSPNEGLLFDIRNVEFEKGGYIMTLSQFKENYGTLQLSTTQKKEIMKKMEKECEAISHLDLFHSIRIILSYKPFVHVQEMTGFMSETNSFVSAYSMADEDIQFMNVENEEEKSTFIIKDTIYKRNKAKQFIMETYSKQMIFFTKNKQDIQQISNFQKAELINPQQIKIEEEQLSDMPISISSEESSWRNRSIKQDEFLFDINISEQQPPPKIWTILNYPKIQIHEPKKKLAFAEDNENLGVIREEEEDEDDEDYFEDIKEMFERPRIIGKEENKLLIKRKKLGSTLSSTSLSSSSFSSSNIPLQSSTSLYKVFQIILDWKRSGIYERKIIFLLQNYMKEFNLTEKYQFPIIDTKSYNKALLDKLAEIL